MEPNWRKPVGMLAILIAAFVWIGLVASFSATIGGLHWAVQALVYAVTGVIWIAPMKPLLRWMETGHWR
ncbi:MULTISPECIES: DUF2842 domain-containing protein [unclassified Sphingomonas]|jgi:hypothetical protein|uniref:DUF2842 domain-containing protein n=1 Tax=unclassified Sphingomonas TaxID=196159 RepID=UPI0008364692|nr:MULTISPECIES: DUF2842 domain-containing protein [unclassified Sphingomonas]